MAEGAADAEQALHWRVRIALGRQAYSDALSVFQATPGLARRSPGLYAQTLVGAGRLEDAGRSLSGAAEAEPTEDIEVARVELALAQGRITEALDRIEGTALKSDARWLRIAAQILEDLGEPREAWQLMLKALHAAPFLDRELLQDAADLARYTGQASMASDLRSLMPELEREPSAAPTLVQVEPTRSAGSPFTPKRRDRSDEGSTG